MWLDCIAAPFQALAVSALGEHDDMDDAVHQLLVLEESARDPRTGLPSHAWDESRRQLWSNPESGRSPSAWTRAIGWFLAAAVDTLEALHPGHHGRQPLAGMIARLAAAVSRWQDAASGLWFQVADQPFREGNFLEISGTCLLSYAFARAGRLGCLQDTTLQEAACRAFDAAAARCIAEDQGGRPLLTGCSPEVVLGGSPYRDGAFACYAQAGTVLDDPVGTAGFILAALERDDAGVRAHAGS
jgi:unsaturated rhamnogalacturonyl hydrolase